MKKKIAFISGILCMFACLLCFAACGKEVNILYADKGDGNRLREFFGPNSFQFKTTEMSQLRTALDNFTFYVEYYPDGSVEAADKSNIKSVMFSGSTEYDELPESLEVGSYTFYFYYEGHKPTADFQDALAVPLAITITE